MTDLERYELEYLRWKVAKLERALERLLLAIPADRVLRELADCDLLSSFPGGLRH